MRKLILSWLVVLSCCVGNAVLAAPQTGWWWNPAESGRGFFVESKGGSIYLAGYFYESDGRATWLVSGGANADPYTYRGRLLRFSGGQTLFGSYQPPSAPTDAGEVSLQFSDDRHATLTWPGGTIALERHVFDARQADLQPEGGWWWNPAESGRGYSIEVQGGSLFLAGFMYDVGGNPVWYFSAGPMATETHYEGALLQYANGQTMSGPYGAPSSVRVGRLILDFESPTTAQMTFTDETSSSSAAAPTARVGAAPASVSPYVQQAGPTRIEREFRYPQPYDPPRGFSGSISWNIKTKDVSESGTVSNDILIDVENAQFERRPEATAPYQVYYAYSGAPGAEVLRIYIDHKQYKADGGSCTGTFDRRFPIPQGGGSFTLDVRSGSYDGLLEFGAIPIDMTLNCVRKSGERYVDHTLVLVPMNAGLGGSVDELDRLKNWYYINVLDGLSVRGSWTFRAIR